MRELQLFMRALAKHKLTNPIPVKIQKKIRQARQRTYRLILKKESGLSLGATAVIKLFYFINNRGKTMTLKGSVRFAWATIGLIMVCLTTGLVLYFQPYKAVTPIETARAAVVIFSIGDVTKITNNAPAEKIKVKDIVHVGDIIKTGEKATISLQIENIGVFRVMSNSEVTLNTIMGANNKTEIYLAQGSVFSKIAKLKKDNYNVKTPSCLAAVRGTEFLTTYKNKVTTVELLKGSVAVIPVDKTAASKLLPEKKLAVVGANQKIEIGALSEIRQLHLEKLGLHAPIKDINKKTDQELKEIFDKIKPQEEIINKKIQKLTIDWDKLSPIEKLKRRGLPVTMFHLSSTTQIAGSIVSRNQDHYTVDTGEGIIRIPTRQIRRMVPVK